MNISLQSTIGNERLLEGVVTLSKPSTACQAVSCEHFYDRVNLTALQETRCLKSRQSIPWRSLLIDLTSKYLRGATDDVLEETYQSTVSELERMPVPSLQVIKSGLDILSLEYPQAKQTDPNLIIDPAIVSRIEQSGFNRWAL